MLLFEEIDKNIQFNSLFLGIRETFISVHVRQVTFFYLRTEKSFPLKQCPLYVLTALEKRKREVYRKETVSHVSAFLNKVSDLEHDRFLLASLCSLTIICIYFSLSHKPDYQRITFRYLPICFTVSVI